MLGAKGSVLGAEEHPLTGQHRPCKQGRCQTDCRCVGKGVGPRDQCRRHGPHLVGATSEFEAHFPAPALDAGLAGGWVHLAQESLPL